MSEKSFSQLVVVGSSAGGIEALPELVSALPAPPPSPSPRQAPKPGEVRAMGLQAPSGPRGDADAQQGPSQRLHSTGEEALGRLPVGVVVLDRNYDIQTINAAARRLLSIHGVAIGEDFLHAMQEAPYEAIRAAIDAAFRNGAGFSFGEFALEDAAIGETRYLRLDCYPQRAEGDTRLPETVMMLVNDVTQDARARRGLEERIEALEKEIEVLGRKAEAEATGLRTQNELGEKEVMTEVEGE